MVRMIASDITWFVDMMILLALAMFCGLAAALDDAGWMMSLPLCLFCNDANEDNEMIERHLTVKCNTNCDIMQMTCGWSFVIMIDRVKQEEILIVYIA